MSKQVIYRTFCPICKGPLDIPVWRRCSSCDKSKNNKYAREKYKSDPKAKEKQRLYQQRYRKANREKLLEYKKEYNKMYVIKSTP